MTIQDKNPKYKDRCMRDEELRAMEWTKELTIREMRTDVP